jgi:hypothetical protein
MVKQVLSLHLDHCLLFMEIQAYRWYCVPSIREMLKLALKDKSELEFGFDAGF